MITFSALTFFTDLRFKEHVFTDHEGSQYVLNIPSNCIISHKLFKANFHCQSQSFSAIQLRECTYQGIHFLYSLPPTSWLGRHRYFPYDDSGSLRCHDYISGFHFLSLAAATSALCA